MTTKRETNSKEVMVRMTPALHVELSRQAEIEGRSLSNTVRRIIESWAEHRDGAAA